MCAINKKELIERLQQFPDNYEVTVDCEPGICDITDVDIDWNNNRIILCI